MKKGRVLVYALGGKNGNSVFRANQGEKSIVTENDVDNFDLLVKQGKIELIKPSLKETEALESAIKNEANAKAKWLNSKADCKKKADKLKEANGYLKSGQKALKEADKKDKAKAQTAVDNLVKVLADCEKQDKEANKTLEVDKKAYIEADKKLKSLE